MSKTNRRVDGNISRIFYLSPRNKENTRWLDHTVFNNKIDKEMCLFNDEKMSGRMFGFRVVNTSCFDKLTNLFDTITYEEKIQTGYSSQNVISFGTITIVH